MYSEDSNKLSGIIAATFTPLTPQGKINCTVIGPYIDYLKEKQSVRGIFVNGTTGESMSLTVEERKELAQEWCEKAKKKIEHVIVHVGCMSLNDSQELARHAVTIGADAIAVMAPCFFKPRNADAMRTYLQEVAKAAPTLPFYYYHIPAVTGTTFLAHDVLEGIEKSIPKFQGVKFSGSDLLDFGQCVHHSKPEWSFFYGMDEQLLSGLAMGADGLVGSTYNYIGLHANQIISAFESGNLSKAREIQFKLQEALAYAFKLGFDVGVNKLVMTEMSGLCLGPPRLPVLPCPPERAQAIVRKFKGVFMSIDSLFMS